MSNAPLGGSAPQRAPLACVPAARAHRGAAGSRRKKIHHSACCTHLRKKEWLEQDAAPRGQTAIARGAGDGELPALPAPRAEASISFW